MKKWNFDQWMQFKAPIPWSKYTTGNRENCSKQIVFHKPSYQNQKIYFDVILLNFFRGYLSGKLSYRGLCHICSCQSASDLAAGENITKFAFFTTMVVYNCFFCENWSGNDALMWRHFACSLKKGMWVAAGGFLEEVGGVFCWPKEKGITESIGPGKWRWTFEYF